MLKTQNYFLLDPMIQTFVRTIINPGKIKVSAGKNFSYSEVSFKKHPNSEGIVKLFTQGYLNDGDMSSFENDLASIFEKRKFLKTKQIQIMKSILIHQIR